MRLSIHKGHYIFLIAISAFLFFNVINLGIFDFNVDEGMYIYHAKVIRDGKIPGKDFFSHQPPLYPIALSIFTRWFPENLFTYRLVSLLAVAITGILIFGISCRFFPANIAVFSTVLFYFAPLQFHGKLALPNALMVLFSSLAFYFLFIKNRTKYTILSGICMSIAILFKPIAISTFLSFILIAVLLKRYRNKSGLFLLTALVIIVLFLFFINIQAEGNLLKLIEAQVNRLLNCDGFKFARGIRLFNKMLYENNITSAIDWNLYSHKMVFLRKPLTNLNFYLFAIALIAIPGMLVRFYRRYDIRIISFLIWLIFPFLFSIFIWTPSWDHYYIEYLPALSIMGTSLIYQVYCGFKKNCMMYIFLVIILLVYSFFGILKSNVNHYFYEKVHKLEVSHGNELFTLNPLINFLTFTKPVCDIIDPLNQYAPFGTVFVRADNNFFLHLIDDNQIIARIESDPRIKIAIDKWFIYLASRRLWEYIQNLDQKRLLYIYPPEEIKTIDAGLPRQLF